MNRDLCGLAFLLTLTAGCARQPAADSPPPAPPVVDGAAALAEAAGLIAISPRTAGSHGAAQAAAHLAGRLRAAGLEPSIDTFTNDAPRGPLTLHNVRARIRGTQPGLIVLMSHFDTKSDIPDFTGANDSASSSGLLLTLARQLQATPRTGPDVLVAFLDGEECQVHYTAADGLHGSRHLARQLRAAGERVHAVILLDMVGDRDLTLTLPRNSTPALLTLAFAAAAQEGARERFSLYPGDIHDDHVPFLEAGFPAIDLIDFEYGSAPGLNDYWHTPADTIDKLSADSLALVGRVVLRMLNTLSAPAAPR